MHIFCYFVANVFIISFLYANPTQFAYIYITITVPFLYITHVHTPIFITNEKMEHRYYREKIKLMCVCVRVRVCAGFVLPSLAQKSPQNISSLLPYPRTEFELISRISVFAILFLFPQRVIQYRLSL